MKVFGQLEKAQLEVVSGSPSTVLSIGRIVFDSASGSVKVYTGSGWSTLGTVVSGGVGNSLLWTNEGPDAAVQSIENNQSIFLFGIGLSQKIYTTLRVPLGYNAGNPIKAYVGAYSPASSSTWQLQSTAYLIRTGQDAFSSTSNSRVSTNAVVTNTVANRLTQVELDLTDTVGAINSVAVSAGDLIKVVLTRISGADTEDTRVLNAPSEVTYQ